MAVALLTNQEIFNAYLVWADQHFQLTFFGCTAPTTWMITIDAALSFSMLVAVAWFWKWRATRPAEPDELGKMIIGSVFTIAGGLCLVIAAATQGDGKIGLFWPVMFHLLNSIGFAHILPVSLALFTRLAPRQINATIIGIYYLAFFLANQIVGQVGGGDSTWDTRERSGCSRVGTAGGRLLGWQAAAVQSCLLGEPASWATHAVPRTRAGLQATSTGSRSTRAKSLNSASNSSERWHSAASRS